MMACDLSSKDQRSRIVMMRERYTVSQFFVTRTEIAKTLYSKIWSRIGDNYLAERVWCFLHAALTRTGFVSSHFLMRGLGEHRKPSVEVKSNSASGARMTNQKKYVHGVIKRLPFSP